jgi:hypothetical protein
VQRSRWFPWRAAVSRRNRIAVYGSAGLLVVAGVVCAAAVAGEAGQILALVLIGSGLVGFIGLAFLEVGLSEDRERDRERRRAERLKRAERRRRWLWARPPRRRGH